MELNSVYCMDNLELLKQLEDESVDLIYCDILYNTGKKFKDYDDNLGTPQQAIEWYRPRLIEMKRILRSTGSLYLQCDYRLVHYLKIEMDVVFGINNFRNEIIWCYAGGGIPKKDFPRKHDNILRYTKTNVYIFNPQYRNYSQNGSGRRSNGEKYDLENGKTPHNDWWMDIAIENTQSKENTGYNTQKPKPLLERIIKASTNEGDVVADFFMGSGTTMVVAKELNRKYIGCDINPRAVEITEQRLKEVDGADG